ncbi:MAG: drug/metabolite exporter YedA [Nitrospirae bacterium]|nr:drug/metabolite exporter YedA [Nitrospirota bacterium]
MVIKAIKGDVKARVLLALLAVYFSWGSTYLAIRIALKSLPPFFMMGIRFFVVGAGLYIFLRMRGDRPPDRSQWINSSLIGGLLLLGGSGGVAYAEQWISSGLAALMIATTPLWTVLFSGIWKHRPTRLEWTGLILGFAGVAILNLEADLKGNPAGAIALMLAAMSWAFGSAWSRQISLPSGMMASAAEMITGGALVLLVSLFAGERISGVPTWDSVAAVLYLAIFGSLVGFIAYMYLLDKVRPALATSYAYVNPIIAIILGVWFAGETINAEGVAAMVVILAGVVLVVMGQRGQR